MKKSIPFIVICLLFVSFLNLSVNAQGSESNLFNTKKTEVNIAVANIFAKNNLFYTYYYLDGNYYEPYIYSNYNPQPELVVGIKFHDAKGAFRIGTNIAYNKTTNEAQNLPVDKYNISVFSSLIYLGYEWHSTFNRVNIYYGIDVSSSYKNTKIKHEYSQSYPYNIVISEYTLNEFTIGINPLVGVNVFITNNLSIGTEFKLIAEYVSGKSKSETTSNYPNIDENKSSGFRSRFGPLGFLSVNIHF